MFYQRLSLYLLLTLFGLCAWAAETLPALPEDQTPNAECVYGKGCSGGHVDLSVVDEPGKAARTLALHIQYPKGKLSNVSATTGLMLDLHNWGGKIWDGAISPSVLADTYNLVVIGVSYYQSGDVATDPAPYDFGVVQTMDALRALYYVQHSLQAAHHPSDATRIYGAGGSGGGNVIQMANKFAPHTFACIVDLSGMASLTDDMAYNLPGGSGLNARYSRDPASPQYLSKGMQEIRDIGNTAHLALQAKADNRCKIVVVHGEDDGYCLIADKRRVVEAMHAAGLDVDAHLLGKADVDGKVVLNTGHSVGNRTTLLQHFAGEYLAPDSLKMCRLDKPDDFKRGKTISYPTSDGVYNIAFKDGMPVLSIRKKK
ncbi:MAG: DUF2920 family protein [Armatimonadota bacterium]